jgi:hypothetical protein
VIRLRLIGDVHGRIADYVALCREAEYTVQVGDLGFRHHYEHVIRQLEPAYHRFVPGNHDDYDQLPPHSLGDFGVYTAGEIEMFFVRGAFSIDKKFRTPGLDWWPEEELSHEQLDAAMELYQQVRPRLMVTHDCPLSVSRRVGDPDLLRDFGFTKEPRTRTQVALQTMLESHPPERWVFGHYHRTTTFEASGTQFSCLGELATLDF